MKKFSRLPPQNATLSASLSQKLLLTMMFQMPSSKSSCVKTGENQSEPAFEKYVLEKMRNDIREEEREKYQKKKKKEL